MNSALTLKTEKARIRVGYRSPSLRTLSPVEKMELCKSLGMEIIEPQIAPHELCDLKQAKEYRQAADRHGITITSAGILLPHQDPDATSAFIEDGDRAIEIAKILGIDNLFTLVRHPAEDVPHQESWDLVKQRLQTFAQKTQDQDIRLSLEPEWFLGSVERVVKMIREVDHPNFQLINFDATNFFTNGSDPSDCIRDHHHIIQNGHIKDGFYRTKNIKECPVGEGEVPWKDIFKTMLDVGHDVTMHIEHCGSADAVRKAATFVQNTFDEIQSQN